MKGHENVDNMEYKAEETTRKCEINGHFLTSEGLAGYSIDTNLSPS